MIDHMPPVQEPALIFSSVPESVLCDIILSLDVRSIAFVLASCSATRALASDGPFESALLLVLEAAKQRAQYAQSMFYSATFASPTTTSKRLQLLHHLRFYGLLRAERVWIQEGESEEWARWRWEEEGCRWYTNPRSPYFKSIEVDGDERFKGPHHVHLVCPQLIIADAQQDLMERSEVDVNRCGAFYRDCNFCNHHDGLGWDLPPFGQHVMRRMASVAFYTGTVKGDINDESDRDLHISEHACCVSFRFRNDASKSIYVVRFERTLNAVYAIMDEGGDIIKQYELHIERYVGGGPSAVVLAHYNFFSRFGECGCNGLQRGSLQASSGDWDAALRSLAIEPSDESRRQLHAWFLSVPDEESLPCAQCTGWAWAPDVDDSDEEEVEYGWWVAAKQAADSPSYYQQTDSPSILSSLPLLASMASSPSSPLCEPQTRAASS